MTCAIGSLGGRAPESGVLRTVTQATNGATAPRRALVLTILPSGTDDLAVTEVPDMRDLRIQGLPRRFRGGPVAGFNQDTIVGCDHPADLDPKAVEVLLDGRENAVDDVLTSPFANPS